MVRLREDVCNPVNHLALPPFDRPYRLMRSEHTTNVYTFIRNKIIGGVYAPGMSLSANALSIEVGVSRTPVHDALRQLEADGLVVIRPRQGATVKFMALKDFRELCWLRKVLESNAAGLAALERTDADLEEVKGAVEGMQELLLPAKRKEHDENYSREMATVDVRFHFAVMNGAHNSLLKSEIIRLRLINRVVSGITPFYVDSLDSLEEHNRTLAEHKVIYRAIAERNVSSAIQAMESHIQDILDHSIKKMRVEEASHMASLGI